VASPPGGPRATEKPRVCVALKGQRPRRKRAKKTAGHKRLHGQRLYRAIWSAKSVMIYREDTRTHEHENARAHTHTHTSKHINLHTNKHGWPLRCGLSTWSRIYMEAGNKTYIHIYTYICIYTRTNIHTHSLALTQSLSLNHSLPLSFTHTNTGASVCVHIHTHKQTDTGFTR
jgi:hypothetical protein